MIIDAHTHTYPETIAKRAIEKLEKNSGTKAHTNGVQSGLMASMKEAGISYSLLLPVATSKKQVDTINEVAAETNAKALETGLLSFGGIHPETENVSEVLNRIKALGLKGIKIHPDYQGTFFNDIRYKRIVEKATELGLYITVHAGVDIGMPDPVHCTPNHVLEVLKDTESDHLILAPMGGWRLWNEVKDALFKKGTFLSGGQQQRLCIARALALKPEVLLMDEPTSALDPIATNRIEELLLELKKEFTIIIVTHNMSQAARISDYSMFMYLGELIEYDKTRIMFTNPRDKRTEEYLTGQFG